MMRLHLWSSAASCHIAMDQSGVLGLAADACCGWVALQMITALCRHCGNEPHTQAIRPCSRCARAAPPILCMLGRPWQHSGGHAHAECLSCCRVRSSCKCWLSSAILVRQAAGTPHCLRMQACSAPCKCMHVQAVHKQWRVPEATLCASALAGGWVGGMWAMTTFRHKTKKASFQEVPGTCSALLVSASLRSTKDWSQKYYASVAANAACTSAVLAMPSLRGRALAALRTQRIV